MEERSFSVRITEENAGRRVDEVLRAVLGMSARQIRLIKAQKGFFLDGRPVYANAPVAPGQTLTAVCCDAYDQGIEPEEGALTILFEDEHLLIVDKPAPMATLPEPGRMHGTLANLVAAHLAQERFIFRPVNRLDRGTSGILVAAKHPLAQKRLMDVLHTDAFIRTYEAIVDGLIQPDALCIDAPIGRLPGDSVRRCVCADGKPARTDLTVLARYPLTNRTRVLLRLHTGRTHQLRVHLAHIGHPVTGDALYGTPCTQLPDRFALHSAHLRLVHPFTGRLLELDSPLPPQLLGLNGAKAAVSPLQRRDFGL